MKINFIIPIILTVAVLGQVSSAETISNEIENISSVYTDVSNELDLLNKELKIMGKLVSNIINEDLNNNLN